MMGYGNYPDLSRVQKILVIKLRHLGDVLLTGPVFRILKKSIPDAQIDALVYEEAKPMLEGHPAISRLWGYDRKWKNLNLWQRVLNEGRLFWEIRKSGYDLVLNLTEGDRGALVAKSAGAQIRVGFTPKGKWQKHLYTHLVKHCPGIRHTVERNLDAVRRIGIFPEIEERELDFPIARSTLESMRKKIGFDPFILIHPTSRWRFKCWSLEKMRLLIGQLLQKGKKVVLTSGPDPIEVEMVESIAKGFEVEVLAGKISLQELGALICLSEVLVCVDSVPLHMASALKHPVVVLFGPTSDITWGPWRNPRAQVIVQDVPCRPCYQDGCGGSKRSDCLLTLPVSRVLSAIEGATSHRRALVVV